MKIILNESKTIQINKALHREMWIVLMEHWRGYLAVLANITKSKNPVAKIIFDYGGKEWLDQMAAEGRDYSIMNNVPLNDYMLFDEDPVLQRKEGWNQEKLSQKLASMKNSTISLSFWIDSPNMGKDSHGNDRNEALGRYHVYNKENNEYNAIEIRFPAGQAAFLPGVKEQLERTLRHELQHFTQAFYADLLGVNKWIGLPPHKSIKDKNLFSPKGRKHQDIPVEMATDLQDEIDSFIPDLKGMNAKAIKSAVTSFVGVGVEGYQSEVFKHYFKTNKDIWKWGVSKLLSAVKMM